MNLRNLLIFLALVTVSGCASTEVTRSASDPFEAENRAIHNFNKAVDRNVVRPVSNGYGTVVPPAVRKGVGNFASNLATPGYVVNNILQGRLDNAITNSFRFATNTVFGLGGIFDVATEAGVPEGETGFGETLHVWGAGEGAYIELPFLGPSTTRDSVGTVVDFVSNPLSYTIPTPERYGMPAAYGLSGLDSRYRYRELVDSILYDSADSYAQARLLYLERRRFELGGASALDDEGIDPFDDPFGVDPYAE